LLQDLKRRPRPTKGCRADDDDDVDDDDEVSFLFVLTAAINE
jgi:hypothetical protein